MQNNKRINITKISIDDIKEYISDIFTKYNCINSFDFIKDKEIYKFESEYSIVEIIHKNNALDKILLELKNINISPYSIGEPIIVINKIGEARPLLPLAKYLLNICKNKITLNEKLSEILTYGKPLIINEKLEGKYYLVLNKTGEFVAYVKVKIEKEKTKIIPLLDIGWYLRKGG